MSAQRDLRKLTRQELLELLLEQGKELDKLRNELKIAKDELADRKIKMREAGSIAEAAMELSGIFEAAQNAADLYLENIRQDYSRSVTRNDANYRDAGNRRVSSTYDDDRYVDSSYYGDLGGYDDEDAEELDYYDE